MRNEVSSSEEEVKHYPKNKARNNHDVPVSGVPEFQKSVTSSMKQAERTINQIAAKKRNFERPQDYHNNGLEESKAQ